MNKSYSYFFRYQSRHESIKRLLQFVKSQEAHPALTEVEMVLRSLRSFWIPFAYRQAGCPPSECQQIARDAVYQLQQHIAHLQNSFEIGTVPIPMHSTQPILPLVNRSLAMPTNESDNFASPIEEGEDDVELVLPELDKDPYERNSLN